ncbi:MAG: S49 family peptidase [Hymenobacteraceae bacterium]|nr:S49 family peptidase [Hymenobacteraceae bacterium]
MQVDHVLSAVLTQPWLINPQSAEGYFPMVLKMLDAKSGKKSAKGEPKPLQVTVISASSAGDSLALAMSKYDTFDKAPEGSIALIQLEGPMMKEDYCGSPGTRTLGRLIQEADSHPNISGHLLYSNTPGGTVAGTENFSAIIKNTQKPFVAYVENMHSAGFWAGSGANVIIIGGQTASAGSIGTMTTINDFSGWYEQMGIVIRQVRATKSVDKNEAYYQAQQGKPEKLQKEVLDPLNEVFLAAVKANRGDKLDLKKEDVLTGKVYYGQTAIDVGLADEMGSFEYAVQRARELADEYSSSNQSSKNNTKSMSIFSKNKFPKLSALAGKKAEEITDADMEAVNEELTAAGIEHAGVISASQLATFEAAVASEKKLKGDNKTLTDANAKLTTDLATAEAEVERLGAMDGDKPTGSAKKGADNKDDASAEDENQKLIDNLPHNKKLDQDFGY